MILGERDRERVTTAEIQVVGLSTELADWQQRALRAEQRVRDEIAAQQRLTAFVHETAHHAAGLIDVAERERDAVTSELTGVVAAIRELHVEADGAPVCRHCGFGYPCPTILAVPSGA